MLRRLHLRIQKRVAGFCSRAGHSLVLELRVSRLDNGPQHCQAAQVYEVIVTFTLSCSGDGRGQGTRGGFLRKEVGPERAQLDGLCVVRGAAVASWRGGCGGRVWEWTVPTGLLFGPRFGW